MSRSKTVPGACLLLVGLLTWLGQAMAAPDEPLLDDVLQELAAGDVVEARALLRRAGVPEEAGAARRCELLEFVIQLAELNGGSRPRVDVLAHGDQLLGRVRPADLPLLRSAQRVLGRARSFLSPFVREAYRAIGPTMSSEELLVLARSPERRIRRLAVSALAEQLAPLREGVLRGNCLSAVEQQRMADPGQLQLLIERLSDRPGQRTDRISADLAARSPGTASALHALVLIEAAALPALENQRQLEGVEATIAAIHSAVSERLRRYPNSTWFCSEGDHGSARGLALEHCDLLVPSSARFCAVCGEQVRHVCPTCGELVDEDSEFCASCGAAATDPSARCVRCGAAAPREPAFCPQCGLDLQEGEQGER